MKWANGIILLIVFIVAIGIIYSISQTYNQKSVRCPSGFVTNGEQYTFFFSPKDSELEGVYIMQFNSLEEARAKLKRMGCPYIEPTYYPSR